MYSDNHRENVRYMYVYVYMDSNSKIFEQLTIFGIIFYHQFHWKLEQLIFIYFFSLKLKL